jgi:hypothetical protein
MLSSQVIAMESDRYAIKWDVMAGGNLTTQSASYAIDSSIGQSVVGFETSSSYQMGSGYWYGARRQYTIYLPVILRSQ